MGYLQGSVSTFVSFELIAVNFFLYSEGKAERLMPSVEGQISLWCRSNDEWPVSDFGRF